MCTGNYKEGGKNYKGGENNGNGRMRPPSGTKCAEACVNRKGRWGSSYCKTKDLNWGAECLPCTGKHHSPYYPWGLRLLNHNIFQYIIHG